MASTPKSKSQSSLRIGKGSRKKATLQFGSVTMTTGQVAPEAVKKNIASGQVAMKKLVAKVTSSPGVKIAGTAPLFYADPNDPKGIVRVVDGRKESGKFEDGKFVARR